MADTDRAKPLEERALREVLVACVTEHDWDGPLTALTDLVQGRDLGELVRRARYHNVVAPVLFSLRDLPGVDPRAVAALAESYLVGLSRQMLAMSELLAVARRLDDAGIPWAVAKGIVLAETLYVRPELRLFGDVDLLVPPAALGDAVNALEVDGAQVLDRNWPLLIKELRGQIHLQAPGGTLLDLHWHLVNRAVVRRKFSISTDDLLAETRLVQIGGRNIPTLGSTTTLAHLCLHAALSGGDRVGWFKDLDRAVRILAVDWDELVLRATRWRARAAVGAMLLKAQHIFATPVPPAVLESLLPPPLRWGILAIDRLVPVPSCSSPRTPHAMLNAGLRDRGLAASPRLWRGLTGRSLVSRSAGHGPELAHRAAAITREAADPSVRQADYYALVREAGRLAGR